MGWFNLWDWRNDASQEAEQFLANNDNSGFDSGLPVYNANASGCTTSQDCASGWYCKQGRCTAPSGSSDLTGCGDGNEENPSCPSGIYDGDCTQTGAGAGSDCGGYEACCTDVRCCRFSNIRIACGCGPCEELDLCDGFCTDYKDANGESAANCDGKGCDECTDCELWGFQGTTDIYKCVPKDKDAAPCHCERPPEEGEGAKVCGDCETCEEDGSCSPDAPECDVCATKSGPCECDPEITKSVQVCMNATQQRTNPGGISLQGLANRRHAEQCEDACKDKCVNKQGSCKTKTYCTDTGTGISDCPQGMRRTGTLQVGEEECAFCEDCSEREGGTDCCPLECNCHDDCGACMKCVDGECLPDPECAGTWVFTGTYYQNGAEKATVYWSAVVPEGEGSLWGFVPAPSLMNGSQEDSLYEGTPNIKAGWVGAPGARGTSASVTANRQDNCNNDPNAIGITQPNGFGSFAMFIDRGDGQRFAQSIVGAEGYRGLCSASLVGSWKVYPAGS